MRRRGSGLLVWVSSSSAHGPCSPFLGPYFAAKAAQDSLAQTTSVEVSRFGIETSIIVPGIFTKGTSHFSSAMTPGDKKVQSEYLDEGPYKGWDVKVLEGTGNLVSDDADPVWVAEAIAKVVGEKRGKRPFRVHIEAEGKMAETVNNVRDMVREIYLTRMGCAELLDVKM
jgi:NAD(P)-dependent dehydrogenase (short-subunit alcohol dehydrogenase family)